MVMVVVEAVMMMMILVIMMMMMTTTMTMMITGLKREPLNSNEPIVRFRCCLFEVTKINVTLQWLVTNLCLVYSSRLGNVYIFRN